MQCLACLRNLSRKKEEWILDRKTLKEIVRVSQMFSQKKGEGYIEHWIMPGVKTSSPWLENLPVKPLSNSNTLQDCRVMQQKIWLHTLSLVGSFQQVILLNIKYRLKRKVLSWKTFKRPRSSSAKNQRPLNCLVMKYNL